MLYVAHRIPNRREDYPSGNWKPEAELAPHPRRLRARWNKAFFIDSGCLLNLALSVGALTCLLGPIAWVKFLVVPCAAVALFLGAISITKEIKVLRFGIPAEGQILGILDDGVDRLFTIYYEDNEVPFQAAITARNNPHSRNWRTGDSVSLILKPQRSGDAQKFLLYPSSSYEVLT